MGGIYFCNVFCTSKYLFFLMLRIWFFSCYHEYFLCLVKIFMTSSLSQLAVNQALTIKAPPAIVLRNPHSRRQRTHAIPNDGRYPASKSCQRLLLKGEVCFKTSELLDRLTFLRCYILDPLYGMTMSILDRWRLPLEVCEKVIESIDVSPDGIPIFYYLERQHALASCALVCRSWVPKSRLHLFNRIRLDGRQQSTRFMDSLLRSPWLGEYVQELSISLLHDTSAGWIYAFIQVLFRHLTNLTHLHYWFLPNLHPIFYSISSPSPMTSLSLHGLRSQSFRQILNVVHRYKDLHSLRIDDCEWDSPSSFYSGRTFGLTTLYLDSGSEQCNEDVYLWLTKSRSVSILETLQIMNCTIPLPTSRLSGVLQQCSQTLRTLQLDIRSSKDASPGTMGEIISDCSEYLLKVS